MESKALVFSGFCSRGLCVPSAGRDGASVEAGLQESWSIFRITSSKLKPAKEQDTQPGACRDEHAAPGKIQTWRGNIWKTEADSYSWEEYREAFRGGVRKARAHLESNLVRVVKGYKKSSHKYIRSWEHEGKYEGKHEAAADLGQGPGGTGCEKAELSNIFLSSKAGLQKPTAPAIQGSLGCAGTGSSEGTPKLGIQQSLGPAGLMHKADFSVRPLSRTLEWPWSLAQGPEGWRDANVLPLFQKGRNSGHCDHPGWSTQSSSVKNFHGYSCCCVFKALLEEFLL